MITTIYDLLGFEEGFRDKPYYCSEGYPTIGKGTVIGTKDLDISKVTLTITEEVANLLMQDELSKLYSQFEKHDWYLKLNNDRKIILLSMGYQMGYHGVMKFRKMIKAIEVDDFYEAGREMMDSRWFKQTNARAKRHINVMETGKLSSAYR